MNYFDKVSNKYELNKFNILHSVIKKREEIVFKQILKRIKIRGKNNAIDLGAGSGFYSKILYSKGIKKITCVDTSKKMLSKIRIKNVNLINKNVLKIKNKKKFDLIIVMGLLEFINNYKNLLKKVTNFAKKNSSIIILMPKLNIFSFFYFFHHILNGNKISFHNEKEVIKLLKFLGWKKINMVSTFPSSTFLFASFYNE